MLLIVPSGGNLCLLCYIYITYAEAKVLKIPLVINEGLGLLKLADTVLILINPSPSNVKHMDPCTLTFAV